jgi:hypothetical protein
MLGRFSLAAIVCATLAFLPASAEAVIILTPADADGTTNDNSNCEPGCLETALGVDVDTLLYKSNVEGGDSGTFANSYTTVFSNSPSDPQDASITYDGGLDPFIDCSACYLAVKDGNQEPAYYFFDLSALGWDGQEEIQLDGFWPGNGAISHVSIWGGEDGGGDDGGGVPEPASALVFGLGALAVAHRARKRFTA